jgi:DNA-binding MarR family transcriptional regulator
MSSHESLTESEWTFLRALIRDDADHPERTGIPSAAPIVERLGMTTSQARDVLDVLEDRGMVSLRRAQGVMPHVQVTWRGRQEAAQRGESIPSPIDDAGELLAFLLDPGDSVAAGSAFVQESHITRRFGWRSDRAKDAARVLADAGKIQLHTPSGGFFVRLTALGRRNA